MSTGCKKEIVMKVDEILVAVFGTKDVQPLLSAIPFDEDGCREIKVPSKGVRLYETQNRKHFCMVGLSLKKVGVIQAVAVKNW